MIKSSRFSVIGILLTGVLCPPARISAQQRPAIADQIAKTYGLDSFGQIDAIRYTFTLESGALKLSRSWVWEPKTDQISYDGKDKAGHPLKIADSRSQLASQSAVVKEQVDPAFINDQYWLLLPFHLVWDTGATVEDAGMQKLPQGKGSARKVVVKYPSGGYTPGDTWEPYVGTDGRIQKLVFRGGGPGVPKLLIATWGDHKKAGPLLIALDHPGTADGKQARLFFSNVAVKLVGSDTWMDAK
jgi:hypothetical protein